MQPAFPNTEYYVEVELRFWYKHYLPEMEARIELCLLSLTRASHGAQTRQLFSYLFFFRPRFIKTKLTFGLGLVLSAFSKQIMCVTQNIKHKKL